MSCLIPSSPVFVQCLIQSASSLCFKRPNNLRLPFCTTKLTGSPANRSPVDETRVCCGFNHRRQSWPSRRLRSQASQRMEASILLCFADVVYCYRCGVVWWQISCVCCVVTGNKVGQVADWEARHLSTRRRRQSARQPTWRHRQRHLRLKGTEILLQLSSFGFVIIFLYCFEVSNVSGKLSQ